jgi:hypothetical protein
MNNRCLATPCRVSGSLCASRVALIGPSSASQVTAPHHDDDDGQTRLRFWQDYAVELDDDAYGIYNFNWGYYLESLRLYCTTGMGQPFPAARRQTA